MPLWQQNSFFVFRHFWCYRKYSIGKLFNVWERKQADQNSLSQKKKKREKINWNGYVILSANYGFINVDADVEISFDISMTQWRCKQCNRKGIRQQRIEGQVVSLHTWHDQLCWKCFWVSGHVIKIMPQTFLACVQAGRQACVIACLSVKVLCVFRREGYLYPVLIQLSKWCGFSGVFLAADLLPQMLLLPYILTHYSLRLGLIPLTTKIV